MVVIPPDAVSIIDDAALTAERWQQALAVLATDCPPLAAECVLTLERLAANIERINAEANKQRGGECP